MTFQTPTIEGTVFQMSDGSWKEQAEFTDETKAVEWLNKKAGMSVHADEKQESGTLIDHVKAYLMEKGEYDPQKEQSFVPALCNRIDRTQPAWFLPPKTPKVCVC